MASVRATTRPASTASLAATSPRSTLRARLGRQGDHRRRALNEGPSTPDTGFDVPWRKQYYDDLLKDSHQHPDEWMTVSDILIESSNIGTIIGAAGDSAVRRTTTTCGLRPRARDGARLPGRVARHPQGRRGLWGSERVTVAYGQGCASTSLQLVARSTRSPTTASTSRRSWSGDGRAGRDETEMPPADARRSSRAGRAPDRRDDARVVCDGHGEPCQRRRLSIAGKTGTAFKAADNGTYFNDAASGSTTPASSGSSRPRTRRSPC